MPVTTYTEDQIAELAIAYMGGQFPTRSVAKHRFLGQLSRALAQLVASIQAGIRDVDRDSVPGSQENYDGQIRPRNSTAALDAWAFSFGLASNRGAGIYGRNGATAAAGGAVLAIGIPGTAISSGDTLVDSTGLVSFETTAAATVGGGGSVSVPVKAVDPGVAGNLATGATLEWTAPPAGLYYAAALTTGLSGGAAEESDLELSYRLIRHLQSPPKGGSAADYRAWAEAALDAAGADIGILRAYIYEHRDGIGSVDVVATVSGSGAGRIPSSAKISALQVALDAKRIATDTVRVVAPYAPTAGKFRVKLKCLPNVAYKYDWNDLGVSILVDAATVSTIDVAGASVPVAALKAAIDIGSKPRIQVNLSGTPLPQVRRVISYAADTPVAGKHRLTLDTALSSAPAVGAEVWAAGGAVEPVSAAVLAEIDGCGPSQQSGYHDRVTDAWVAVVAVSNLARAALDAVGSDGTRCLAYSASVGAGVGITMSQNGGPYSGADIRLYDNVAGQGPQIPECTAIVVIA